MKARALLLVLLVALGIHLQGAAPVVLVAGYDSDNVVEFDLGTGRWSELAQCPAGSQPRGLAVGATGDIYIGFHGGNRNIAQLVRGKAGTEFRDVTQAIGRFGPGFMAFGAGRLWLAGDTDRVIYQVNPASGDVSPASEYRNPSNIVGLTADGESLYATEYFQRSVLRFDLRTGLTNVHRLVTNSPHLNRPVGMTIGHNGNLYVANSLTPTVVEFDIKTGAFVRTLVDLGAGGQDGIHGVVFAPEVGRYYFAAGSDVFEVNAQGKILASYNSPALKRAYGIALLPARLRTASVAKVPSAASAPRAATANPPPVSPKPLTTLRTTAGGLQIMGTPGERYRVMATTDFKTWQAIATLDNPSGLAQFMDPAAGQFAQRFYRLELVGQPK